MTENLDGQVCLFGQDSWSGRTCRELSVPTKARTSGPSSKKRQGSSSRTPLFLDLRGGGEQAALSWETDGVSLGVYSTHSFGECPSVAVESRLSQILEATPHPKYYLSAKACAGILRRAERRGKALPLELEQALVRQASSECEKDAPGGVKDR